MNIADKIKTVEDAYKLLGMEREKSLPVITNVSEEDLDHIVATYDLEIVTRALNQGWEADFSNRSQLKYFNWFYVDDLGAFRFGFAGSAYACTYVGSRLCFKHSELAEYAANQFIELYKKHYLS